MIKEIEVYLEHEYKGKRVLVTGHTGFKGAWLCKRLLEYGAIVYGIGREPHTNPNYYTIQDLKRKLYRSWIGDLRDKANMIAFAEPEIVFHLAANAIVADGFPDPAAMIDNNVMSALNVLEAARRTPSIKALVMITTDKVYYDENWIWPYREEDALGGTDPYSVSKVCIEHVINCYRTHFFPMIATARAGNVIGGGDWGKGRIFPDIMRAVVKKEAVEIHTPNATRPWQHVTEPLRGYLMLGAELMRGNKNCADCFNFGPDGEMTVAEVLEYAREVWPLIRYEVKEQETHPGMVNLLKIDNTKAKKVLGWEPIWSMEESIWHTVTWYKNYYERQALRKVPKGVEII